VCIPISIPYQHLFFHLLSFSVRHTFHHIHSTIPATTPAIPIILSSNQCNTFRKTPFCLPQSFYLPHRSPAIPSISLVPPTVIYSPHSPHSHRPSPTCFHHPRLFLDHQQSPAVTWGLEPLPPSDTPYMPLSHISEPTILCENSHL